MTKPKSSTVWRSVAIEKTVYESLKHMAETEDRSVSKQLAHLIKVAAREAA
jgi:hypothetical protein|tara:strand:+ start:153 stop:305 length:153 start_codon:yes stop_codon:yes gene_type:complete